MADEGGSADHSLGSLAVDAVEAISKEPRAWEFFAAVRALHTRRGSRPPVGLSTRIEQDFIRFKQEPSLSFQPAELLRFKAMENADQPTWELTQIFFGFFGPNGPLPVHITEDAILDKNSPEKNRLLPDFCDIFQHRLTSLLYHAWQSCQIAASRDLGGEDPFKRRIGSFYGEGTPGMSDREALSDDTKRFMAGHLSTRRGSVATLESVVEIVTGAPAKVDQFVGEWLEIPEEDRSTLGTARLGVDTTLGARAFSAQSRIAIRTARLDFDSYEALLPDGELFGPLRDAVRHVIDLGTAWELRPILKVSDIPQLTLDGNRRLGWDTWIGSEDRMQDGNELALEGSLQSREVRAREAAHAKVALEDAA